MKRQFQILLLATSIVSVTGSMHAQVSIVNWGGNYVSGMVDLDRQGTAGSNFGNVGGTVTNDSRRLTTFSDSTTFNPSASYTGTSSAFYGGIQVIRYDNSSSPATGQQRIENNSSTDRIQFRTDLSSGTGSGEAQGLVVWKKSDFLSLNSTTSTLSSLSITLDTTTNLSEARWVVQNGSTYYISQTTFTASATLSNPSSTNWAVYDPASEIKFTGSSFSAVSLSDVSSVGVYFAGNSLTWTSATVGGLNFAISQFSASAVSSPVPEPASYAFFGGLAVLGLAGARRFRSRRVKSANFPAPSA